MGYLYISEFANSGNSKSGAQMQLGVQPAVGLQKINYTGDAPVQSQPFAERTYFIRVYCTADCHVSFALDPTATNNHMFLPAGTAEYFGVLFNHRLSVLKHVGH